MVGRLIALLLLLFAALHAYFFFAFGTFDPCTAATFKVLNQGKSEASRVGGLLFSGPVEKLIRSKGALNCYRVAITGESPENLP